MARLTKAYFSAFHKPQPHRSEMVKDEVRTYQANFNGALSSESVSSVSWDTDDTSLIAITGATVSAGIASVTVTASNNGTARLSCTATLDTARKLKRWFHIRITDKDDVR